MLMGTRADFYVGTGESAEWIGSARLDGNEWAEVESNLVANAATADEFRVAVRAALTGRSDGILPEHGWPWPWDDSCITDFVHYFDDTGVHWKKRKDWPSMAAHRLP